MLDAVNMLVIRISLQLINTIGNESFDINTLRTSVKQSKDLSSIGIAVSDQFATNAYLSQSSQRPLHDKLMSKAKRLFLYSPSKSENKAFDKNSSQDRKTERKQNVYIIVILVQETTFYFSLLSPSRMPIGWLILENLKYQFMVIKLTRRTII